MYSENLWKGRIRHHLLVQGLGSGVSGVRGLCEASEIRQLSRPWLAAPFPLIVSGKMLTNDG